MVGWGFRQRLADLCLPVEAEHFGLLQTSVDGGGVLYKKHYSWNLGFSGVPDTPNSNQRTDLRSGV